MVIMGLNPRTIFIFTLIFVIVINFFREILYVFHNNLT